MAFLTPLWSTVIGVWTGNGFSAKTEIDLNGRTSAIDCNVVVEAWIATENCAP